MNAMRAIGLAILATLLSGCKDDQIASDDFPREKLLDSKTCNLCHQDHYSEWLGSMHAYASRDPLFLAMNKRGQEETQGKLGNFCVNCHAPMAAHELGGNGDTIDPSTIPPQLQGVTCYFCHNVTEVQGTHNNSLVLADDTTMRGGFTGPEPLRHKAAYSSLHASYKQESAALCGGCHDIVVPAHFSGATIDPDAGVSADGVKLEQTYAEWRGSTFAGGLTCGQCHMQFAGNQPIANPPLPHPTMKSRDRHLHDFPAVDTAFSMPDFPDTGVDAGVRDAQERRVTAALDGELRVETCVDLLVGAPIVVTLENAGAGHNFPSGASQDRRLWIELHVFEKQKQPDGSALDVDVYQSGVVPAGQSVVQAAEDAAARNEPLHLFRDVTTKKDGSVAHMFWDVARIRSGTIPVSTLLVPVNAVQRQYGLEALKKTHIPHPSRVTVKVWLEPVGIDVIDDLVKSGHIPDGDAMPSLRNLMPRRLLVPSRLTHPDAAPDQLVTLDWVLAAGADPNNKKAGCVQSTAQ